MPFAWPRKTPEKYAGMPLGTRATQLPDGEIQNVFLKTFGQPARELACECERENESSLRARRSSS